MVQEMLSRKPDTGKKPSKTVVYWTMYYTLNISVRFLFRAVTKTVTRAYGDYLMHWWAARIFRKGNASLSAVGLENLEPGETYIFMSNHKSLVDVPAAFLAAPGTVRMVLKRELTKVPVWGQALVAAGFIPVDRGNTTKAIEQLNKAKERFHEGTHVWIFPEGTRARDGVFAPFKKGGFHTALQLEAKILPVWIEGADQALPPDSFSVHHDKDVLVRFGKPIDTNEFDVETMPALMGKVRAAIEGLRDGAATEQRAA